MPQRDSWINRNKTGVPIENSLWIYFWNGTPEPTPRITQENINEKWIIQAEISEIKNKNKILKGENNKCRIKSDRKDNDWEIVEKEE